MTSPRLLLAQDIGLAAKSDPQLEPPKLPRLAQGIEMVVFSNGLVLANGWQPVVLRGAAATALLPRLLPLVDGRSTVPHLAATLEVPEAAVHNAIALLHSSGVLEDAAADGGRAMNGLAMWLSRMVDSVRVHGSGPAAAATIGSTRVRIFGSDAITEPVGGSLEASGMQVAYGGALERGDFGLQLATGAEPTDGLAAFDDACATLGVAWLRAHLAAERLELGPLFVRGELPCYRCLVQAENDEPLDGREPVVGDLGVWAEVVAAEVIGLVSRAFSESSGMRVCRLARPGWSITPRAVARQRGCARCGLDSPRATTPGKPSWALQREAEDATPPDILRNRRAQLRFSALHQQPQGQVRAYAAADHLDLPAAPWDRLNGGRHNSGTGLGLDELSLLLLTTYGFRAAGNQPERYVPSAGNLGSVEAFLELGAIDGVPAGLFAYEPLGHRLARLPRRAGGAQGSLRGAQDVVIQVAALDRASAKYGPLAWRLAHLDAGVALAQLDLIAAAAGVSTVRMPKVDARRLLHELDLDPGSSLITAVRALVPGLKVSNNSWEGLGDILIARRSHRTFAPGPVAAGQLAQVLAAAASAGPELSFRLLLARVAGIDPGVYSGNCLDPGRWHLVGALPPPQWWLQPEFQAAPAVLVLVGNATGPDERTEVSQQLVQTGAALHRADLRARTLGLVGCMFLPAVGQRHTSLGCDGYETMPLLALAVGLPVGR